MRFLGNTFLICCGIFAALLFWWRPAPELISVKPMDWGREYEKQHTPAQHLWGAMEMAREWIRSDAPHQPLTEFIALKTRGRLIREDNNVWQVWYERYFQKEPSSPEHRVYFSPLDPPVDTLKEAQGYLELRGKDVIHSLYYNRLKATEVDREDIPKSLRYPYRILAAILLGATLLFWGTDRFRKKAPDLAAESSAGTGCKVFMAGLSMGMALLTLPFLYYKGDGGFPAFFLGVFAVLMGVIGLLFFGVQVLTVRKMINGKDQFAHWTYEPEAWDRFTQWEFTTEKEEKRGLFLFISAIIVAVGLGFWMLMRDKASFWVFLFLLGLVVLLWLAAVAAPRLTYRRLKKGPGEVYMGSSGIYVNGTVHTWNLIGSRFESVEIVQKPFPMLVFVYSYLMAAGRSLFFFRQYASVRVPIPEGMEGKAREIANHYQKKG